MSADGIWAVVPVKETEAAKQRLALVLPAVQRQALALAMLEDLLAALAEVPAIAGIALVNPAFGLRGPDAQELTAILNQYLDRPDGMKQAHAAWQEHDAKNPSAKSWRRHAAGLP